MRRRPIVLSESDFAHLNAVIDGLMFSSMGNTDSVRVLQEQLEAAEVVSQREVPTNVVRMNSQVYVTDLDSHKDTVYTLVFPQDADIERHRVSVLAPLGAALVGSRTGQIISVLTPRGRRRLRVGAIVDQHDAVPAA